MLLRRAEAVTTGAPRHVLTPEILEPVYGIAVRRLDEPECVQLIFSRAAAPPGCPSNSGVSE